MKPPKRFNHTNKKCKENVIKLVTQTPKKALKAFLKQKPLRSEMDVFKTNLIALLDKISVIEKRPKDESEEHLKNDLRDFLRDTYYRNTNTINTKDKKDLVIHLDKTTNSDVGVIIEAKRPTNTNEMVSASNPNKKALHELILYYLDERNKVGNINLKQLVITNVNEWYIIDANHFDKHIYRNAQIKKLYETKISDKKDNPFFYEEIEKIVAKIDVEIPCVYFDIREYDTILRNNKKEDDRELIGLLKILSPQHLLKLATPNDSNSLNERFYNELLHIIGLEEAKENGKNIIRRKKESRNPASLIELTIDAIQTEDLLHKLPDQSIYGATKDERIFNVSLELCITWINRILFLKLLEGQLLAYHQSNKEYRFLNTEMINSFDELFKLFHKVLAVNIKDRTEAIKGKYSRIPYLNSSLFEISELEDQTIKINSLDNEGRLELINTTILKEAKKKAASLPTLDYLFNFLDAYDFASEGAEDVQEDNKTIINASVLGKVFEKINGYKDGSVFTPAFITMYMCKQSIRLAVVEKFNDVKKWNIKQFDELYNKIDDKNEANEIINSLKICDPAVGSGHFLVSALNQIIAVKSELGILIDEKGKTLRDYEIEIVNDELIITDENGNIIAYNPKNLESNRVQKTLFQEKQTIIENCLFGVDINPNSVKICRLRLWIELLKNAYYKEETKFTELETLPNIDINIKCGNSLLSRFALDADLSKALKSIKYDINDYRGFVNDYKNEKSRDVKRGLQKIINDIKSDFRTEITKSSKDYLNWYKAKGELDKLTAQFSFFEMNAKEKKKFNEYVKAATEKLNKYEKIIEDIKTNALYKNAFEWCFEFPEVLSNNGEFLGFDLVIGNPPYILISRIDYNLMVQKQYHSFEQTGDIYLLFFELGLRLLKKDGIVNFITSNKWLKSNYGRKFRKFIKLNASLNQLIDFNGNKLFEEASVDTAIFSFSKQTKNSIRLTATQFPTMKNLESTFLNFIESNKVILTNLHDEGWIIGSNQEYELKVKIENHGLPLKDWAIEINRGLISGFSEAFIINEQKKNELLQKNIKNNKIIKPLLRGRNIRRYKYESENLYLIHTHNGIKEKNIKAIDVEKEYPFVFEHLKKYQSALEKRLDKGNHWSNLRNCVYFDQLEQPKIIYPDIAQGLNFTLDEAGYFINNTAYFFNTGNKYLLAVLNSKVVAFYYHSIAAQLGSNANRAFTMYIEQIPIPKISETKQKPFINLVDKIIAQKAQGKDTNHLEKQIDELVYKLYDITTNEQKIIEGQ
jgi:adenine-specific DNA-methyltransferase